MRESILRDLAQKAATDPEFLHRARKDLEGTLAHHGFDLTPDELKTVQDLQRRTAVLGDKTLAAMLAAGLANRTGESPVRPTAPARPGSGFTRPVSPEGPGGRRGGRGPRPGE